MAVRSGRKKVNQTDFEEAIEKSVAGLQARAEFLPKTNERKSPSRDGHALTAFMTPGSQPVTKNRFIPRGMSALGYTLQYPTEDRFLMSEAELLGNIDTMLGGRAAEKSYSERFPRAGNDISRASDLVRRMITEFGMTTSTGTSRCPRAERHRRRRWIERVFRASAGIYRQRDCEDRQ
jgi:cell division protease FtsH